MNAAPADARPHVHAWKVQVHLDGCHHYSTNYRCDCGAVRVTGAERAFRDVRSFSAVWALPDDCERCAALLAGARRSPRYDSTLEPGADHWRRTPKEATT